MNISDGYFSDIPSARKARFDAHCHDHPDVYLMLVIFARKARQAGHNRYSVNTIWERLRWHSDVEARCGGYKLNNNFRALYARKVMAEHADLAGFFELRPCRPHCRGLSHE